MGTLNKLVSIALMFCLVSFTAYSKKCKHITETTDAFTNETVKKAVMKLGYIGWSWTFTMEQRGSKCAIRMHIIAGGDVRLPIKKGDKIPIRLGNREMVELMANEDYAPVWHPAMTEWNTVSDCDIETFKKLAQAPITAIRISLPGVQLDLPKVLKPQPGQLMAAAACMAGIEE